MRPYRTHESLATGSIPVARLSFVTAVINRTAFQFAAPGRDVA